jgi:copper transport protein
MTLSRLVRLVLLAGVVGLLMLTLQPVQAHAVLERSDPPDNVFLAEAPRVVRLWFSEPVAIKFSSVRLLDTTGSEVKGISLAQDPADLRQVHINLPLLGKGLYSLAWQVLSAADGHDTTGLLVFGVGLAPMDQPNSAGMTQPPPKPGLAFARTLVDAACCGLFGALVISLGLLFPARAAESLGLQYEDARRRAANWSLGLAGLAFIASILVLSNQFSAGNSLSGMWDLLLGTDWGRRWVLHAWFLLIIVVMIWRTRLILAQGSSWLVWTAAAFLAAAALAAQAYASHASGLAQPLLPLFSNLAHLMAAGIWTGGLAVLLTAARLRPLALPGAAGDFSRTLWSGFGRFAAVSAGVVIATGLLNSSWMVTSTGALRTSLYGNYLLLKIGLVALVCLAGLINSLSLHPTLFAPLLRLLGKTRPLPARITPFTIGLEAAFGLGVFLLAGYLGSTSPANGAGYQYTGITQDKSISRQVNDLVMTFAVQPNHPGQNFIQLQTTSVRRPAPAEIARVIFRLTYLGQDLGTQSVNAALVEPGVYRLSGGYLSLPGPWKIEVVVRRLGLPDTISDFEWNVLPIGSGPWNIPLQAPLLFLAVLVLLLTCLLAGRVFLPRRARPETAEH